MHACKDSAIEYISTLVLIAQVAFLLQREHIHRHTNAQSEVIVSAD